MNEFTRIVEINGIKVEVDLRTAKVVEQFKVGDGVKVLTKEYNNNYAANVGVIVGFDMFQSLPTITVAYVKEGYLDVEIKFASINSESKEIELAPLQDHERRFDFNKALLTFDRYLEKKEIELAEIKQKKQWFQDCYGKYFSDILKG